MMLSFDLEGISNDGFGYTVSITGASNRRLNCRSWFRATWVNLLDLRGKRECPPPAVMRELEVPVRTEVIVAESRNLCP